MKTKKFDLIIISGRRWFQKTYGNTYHSVTVEVRRKGKETVYLKSGIHYGYGDSFEQTAAAMLQDYFPDWSSYCNATRNSREKFVISVSDVPRERDLK